ncbi:hypothetical protein M9H77_35273 [Catharanthus roseus]|uniref:Uncharacterized protein n=1 Tax=Catharanthus roseus TaxID=4058 RepID=A0ACB9ZQF3_CATRO|nr:hypothetical protein M9H77_35273 [Catharanthus roseus]
MTISRSGVYYPSLGKEFYINMTQKNNKDLITVKTTVMEVNITLDRTLLAHVTSIPNEGKEKFTTTSFDIIDGDTTSRRRFEYSKTEKRWIARSGLSRLEDFGYICTKPNCCSGKVVADEKEDEDDEEETEGSGKEYDD